MNLISSIHDTSKNPIAETAIKTEAEQALASPNNQQVSIVPGTRVYLYGDTHYTGVLIRSIERTYPPKWSLQLDSGSYEAVNVEQISLLESQASTSGSTTDEDLNLSFGDPPESSYAFSQIGLNVNTKQSHQISLDKLLKN